MLGVPEPVNGRLVRKFSNADLVVTPPTMVELNVKLPLFWPNHLGNLDARELLDLVGHQAATVKQIPIGSESLGHFWIVAHRSVPGLGWALCRRRSLNHSAEFGVGILSLLDLWNVRNMLQDTQVTPLAAEKNTRRNLICRRRLHGLL